MKVKDYVRLKLSESKDKDVVFDIGVDTNMEVNDNSPNRVKFTVEKEIPRQHKLWWQSSYDRGIQYALKMWPSIKEKYPDATFDICYGWNLFLKAYSNNPERMKWMEKVKELMKQDGITEHGKIGQAKMKELRSQCGIWFYPTDFDETNCIGALECQDDGVVPCTMNKAGLKDTVGSGVKIDGEIWDPEVREKYLTVLLDLMGDENKWKEEQEKGKKFVKKFYRGEMATEWTKEF